MLYVLTTGWALSGDVILLYMLSSSAALRDFPTRAMENRSSMIEK